jgi:acyl-coenzyme A thioesterase PaaI-like protein
MPPIRRYRVDGSHFMQHTAGVQYFIHVAADDTPTLHADVQLGQQFMGPPRHVHGGMLASILDEAMGVVAHFAGHKVVSAKLSFDYLRPVPLTETFHVEAYIQEALGRKVFVHGRITLENGDTATESSGLFITVPELFGEWGFGFTAVDDTP